MHYRADARPASLKHDPFKALVVPRPIGWVGTVDAQGRPNLAPYSFFNAVSDRPPMLMFSSGGTKDTLANILATGEFTCSLAGEAQRDAMNLSSAPVNHGINEFALAGLAEAPSIAVRPPWVGGAPAAFECRLWRTIDLPAPPGRPGKPPPVGYTMVIGEVVAVHIDDALIHDGIVDTGRMRALARLGYMDYAVLGPETLFTLNRPTASADGTQAELLPGPWDGVYR